MGALAIVAKRLVEHLERAGFVVMKRPAEICRGSFLRQAPESEPLSNPTDSICAKRR